MTSNWRAQGNDGPGTALHTCTGQKGHRGKRMGLQRNKKEDKFLGVDEK